MPDTFFERYRSRSPAELSEAELQDLLQRFGSAVEQDLAAPAGFGAASDVHECLRSAAARKLSPAWQAYLEYYLAWDAVNRGDAATLRSSAEALAAFARSHPDVGDYAAKRTLLLADIQRALGDFRAAAAAVDRLQSQLPAVPGNAAVRSNLFGLRSEILRETGCLEQASLAVRESLALAKQSGDPDAIARALVRDQAMALVTGRFAASREAIEEMLAALPPDADESRAMLLLFRGHAESGLAGEDPKWIATARETLSECRSLTKGHLRTRADLKRLDLALRAEDVAGAREAFADCEQTLGPGCLREPLSRDAIELIGLRTELLLQSHAPVEDLRAWQVRQKAAQVELGEEWRRQPLRRDGTGFLALTQRRSVFHEGIALELALATAERRADGPKRALQLLLDLQLSTSLARATQAESCTVEDLQKYCLQPGAIAVVFMPSRSLTWAFVVDREGVGLIELPGSGAISAATAAWLAALARAPGIEGEERDNVIAKLRSGAERAREVLLPAPLLDRVRTASGLTVVGADLLGGVPFEAMMLADGRLLGEVLPIDNTSALPVVVAANRRPLTRDRGAAKLLVLGCMEPVHVAEAVGSESVPFPTAELQKGIDAYATAMVLKDAEVTRDVVLGLHFADFDVVHVVAHHAASRDAELGGGLVVRDGVIWRADLDGRSASRLVIVSACGAGRGPARIGEGEGFSSFTGAFLCGGAEAVICSRNELLALDHLRTMSCCHQQLACGLSPARAMQLARAQMAKGSDLLARAQRALVQVSGAGQRSLFRP